MRLPDWLTRNSHDPSEPAPPEVPWLRGMGVAVLVAFVVVSCVTDPRPALHGQGLLVLVGLVIYAVTVARGLPVHEVPTRERAIRVTIVAAVSVGLLALQPTSLWIVTPYVVGSIAASRLPDRLGAAIFVADLAATLAVANARGHGAQALSVAIGSVPWFLFMRVMRRMREAHRANLTVAATAAAERERGRLAREMHDVLAHSLSALSLQLESTRLLAADRGTDPDVLAGVERAHALAASGLQEARRAVGALRGDELPGPQRLGVLARESGLPVRLDVTGEPRELAPDARLALYRTAQEALTNVRRHAHARDVELRLDYRPDGTLLVVADHGEAPPPPPKAGGNGGGFGLTGMRERAELLGGRLSAAPTGDGFRVELWLPA